MEGAVVSAMRAFMLALMSAGLPVKIASLALSHDEPPGAGWAAAGGSAVTVTVTVLAGACCVTVLVTFGPGTVVVVAGPGMVEVTVRAGTGNVSEAGPAFVLLLVPPVEAAPIASATCLLYTSPSPRDGLL